MNGCHREEGVHVSDPAVDSSVWVSKLVPSCPTGLPEDSLVDSLSAQAKLFYHRGKRQPLAQIP